jgi:putative heme-binding domain-containing protein
LLNTLPEAQRLEALRSGWSHAPLRDRLLPALAARPMTADRARFVDSLSSFQATVVEHAATALAALGAIHEPFEVQAAITALRRLCRAPPGKSARLALVGLLERWSGRRFPIMEQPNLPASYAPWFEWFDQTHPRLSRSARAKDDESTNWGARLARVAWEQGDASRGQRVFEERLCVRCHSGTRSGPDLAGITSRFSREDLFNAIIEPERDISPLWQGMTFTLKNGTAHIGTVVYESPTTTLIQTGPDVTVRLSGAEIESVEPSRHSLMPSGLLAGLGDRELADLYAFLQTLRP